MNSPVPPQQEPRNWLQKKIKSLHWRIHATFPNTIPSPHHDDRAYYAQHAREQNEETKVPESKHLRRNAVWGIEIFGPSEIESFYRQLKKLNWQEPHGRGIGKNAIETIKQWRTYGRTGNFNIGVVKPKNSGFHHVNGPVPQNVDYLLVNIAQFTPELTCLIVGFVFKEEITKVYETELNKYQDYQRRAILGRFTYSTHSPENLKRESIDNERSRCRIMVASWLNNNFPGFFKALSSGKRLPIVELITCTDSSILTHHDEILESDDWERLLIPHGWGDIWTSKKYSGFRMRRSEAGDDVPLDSVICLKTSTLPEEQFSMYGGITPGSIVAFVHERIEAFICQNAVLHMLHEISRTLKTGRENLEIGGSRYGKLLKSIGAIKVYFDRSIGFPAILREIKSKAENDWAYKWREGEFFDKPWRAEIAPTSASETLRQYTLGLSQRVIDDDAATREHFEQVVSILSTRESVKTQRRMEYLTYLTIFLALGSLAISISPDLWVQKVKIYVAHQYSGK